MCECVHKSVSLCVGNVTSKQITGERDKKKGCVQRSRLTSACKKTHSHANNGFSRTP